MNSTYWFHWRQMRTPATFIWLPPRSKTLRMLWNPQKWCSSSAARNTRRRINRTRKGGEGGNGNGHDGLSRLSSMKFSHQVGFSQWTWSIFMIQFLGQDAILEGYFENIVVIIWFGHQYRIISGFESKHLDEHRWSYPYLKLYVQSYFACTNLDRFVSFSLCLGRWKGCSLDFSRHKKGCSYYSVGNTKRLAFPI